MAPVASVLPFVVKKSDFDDEATRLMGEAFDAACKALHDTGQPALSKKSSTHHQGRKEGRA
jgi:hypothetical protein